MVPSQAVNPEVRSLSPHPIVCRNLTQSSALFPQPRPLCWSLITPAVNLNQNPNRQMHLEGSPCPQNDPIPPWSHIVNVSHLQTNFLPQYHPEGGSWGPSQSVNQSNQSIHQVTSKLLMDWLLKGRGCGFQFGPTLTFSWLFKQFRKTKCPHFPLPHSSSPPTPSIHQSIGPSVHFPSPPLSCFQTSGWWLAPVCASVCVCDSTHPDPALSRSAETENRSYTRSYKCVTWIWMMVSHSKSE